RRPGSTRAHGSSARAWSSRWRGSTTRAILKHLVWCCRPPPKHLSIAEEREAARALRGRMLRQEIYAEAGLPESAPPYAITEHTFDVRLLQREQPVAHGEGHANAVFFVHSREDLTLHYERRPDDPRIQHQLTLDVDDLGNVLQSAALAYPRR